jgi:hypothetical protein
LAASADEKKGKADAEEAATHARILGLVLGRRRLALRPTENPGTAGVFFGLSKT